MALYLGLISGTSMDAIDAALVEIDGARCQVRHARAVPYAPQMRDKLFRLVAHPENVDLDQVGALDTAIGAAFAVAALQLLQEASVSAAQITAIGSHGQTLRHRPDGPHPFTWQIGNPDVIAERTGITTVADFRRRDVAAGGQGAPLAPALHQAMLSSPTEARAVINIGGIANVTWLPPDGTAIGFDTGPGNCLMDGWSERHRGAPFDRDGQWAASGRVDMDLLQSLLSEPYLAKAPPKSTGRELFNLLWLDQHLAQAQLAPADVQSTLCEFSARTIADACALVGNVQRALLCGGGAHNRELRRRLQVLMPSSAITTTAQFNLDPDYVEAAAFAWIASRTLAGLPGNLPSVTGARHRVVLGSIHPAGAHVIHS
ncbi:MAG TPA: anhydro-N-acetylmuramic acid kinase [Steroidobacteraceae bacterium]|nr:anhydro-N-acetylmuramic acid kinase [Steroidobacteraceae bacterium]